MHEYKCTILRVVDGDTVDVDIDLGFGIWMHKERVRIHGIDTPESRTRNKHEKILGLRSKARLKELIAAAPVGKRGRKEIYLSTTKVGKGKFGRILGYIWVNDENVNNILTVENHARPYFGGSKGELGAWIKEEDGVIYRWTSDGYIKFD